MAFVHFSQDDRLEIRYAFQQVHGIARDHERRQEPGAHQLCREGEVRVLQEPELPRSQVKAFLTATGMLGWLAQTVRCDASYAYSRIAQHCAHPTESAMKAVRRCFKYLLQTKHLALCISYLIPGG